MRFQLIFGALVIAASPCVAAPEDFTQGPVITGFGAISPVQSDLPLPAGMDYKVAFDVKAGEPGKRSTGIDGAARLMNMLAANGVPISRIHPAIVIHHAALFDVVNDARYAKETGIDANPTADLVRQLIAKGVPIYVCGQTAAQASVSKSDLLPGVKMALSAMTAHAILQHQGYSLNPF
ncbi:MAG TPA: DsrE family protein [Sphingomicrobium sp.]|nr:DsrE family protein [Sphingomicrobium sp.]